ncbi:MAG: IclR family transcriptional regulator [Proteobacteria bacterium]|nr:IclR family transcriptional regulator [Pseudomonadota bacterium]
MNKGSLRVLNVLSLFSRKPLWGVTEVSRELGCAKNSAFEALDTLHQEGYVIRDTSGQKYQLSHVALGFIADGDALDVRSLCQPYLSALQRLTNESAFLSIIVGRYNVCIDSIQADGVKVGYSPLSQPIPLHAGSGSRALLGFLQDDEVARYIEAAAPLQRVTPTTIVEPEKLWAEIKLVRSRGFARSYEDFSTGANFLSFPVLGAMDRPLAAITIGGPVQRFTIEIADASIPAIRSIMAELNQHSRMFPAVPIIRF